MDEVATAGYVVPCAVCSAVNWAISADLKYYCKTCHNVIDKTAEVADHSFMGNANRVTDLAAFRQRRMVEYGRKWKVCEGFQFILKHQAETLIRLGVTPQFKDDVLCQLWRLYLQRSRQAYSNKLPGSRVPSGARATDHGPSAHHQGSSSSTHTGAPSTVQTGGANEKKGPSANKRDCQSTNRTEGIPSANETDAQSENEMEEGHSANETDGRTANEMEGGPSANETDGRSANEMEGGPSANETDGRSANEKERSPSAREKDGPSASETDEGPDHSPSDTDGGRPSLSGASSDEDRPKRHKVYPSGSEDSAAYLTPRMRHSNGLMSMNKTLGLLYLGLLWCREALTLSDLLRLVRDGHLPFINAFECLPEEMKLFGRDLPVFRVQSIPSYRAVHREAFSLAVYMKLPSFPSVVPECLQHPTLLTLRYLLLLNLPDQLHPWVCRVLYLVGLDKKITLTFDPQARAPLPYYDVLSAALIVVTLKLLFGLDDSSEWNLSNGANDKNKDDPDQPSFSLRRWYRLLQAALVRARLREEEHTARMQWTSKKPIYPSWERKGSYVKKGRMVDQLRTTFTRLAGSPAEPAPRPPSSFRFRWGEGGGEGGEGGGWDGPSLRLKRLDAVVRKRRDGTTAPVNVAYWHPPLMKCKAWPCRSHFEEDRATLPKMYRWLLELFSFLLGVKEALVHEEVLRVERRLLLNPPRRRTRRRKGETGKTGRANLHSVRSARNPSSFVHRKKEKP